MFLDTKEQIRRSLDIYKKYVDVYKKYNENKILQFSLNYFISLLPKNSKILDAGCGTGRDSLYFLEENFNVLAVDISKQMLEEAKNRGLKTINIDLVNEELNEKFNGIWCMSLISELTESEAKKLIANFYKILENNGILYLSLKYGSGKLKYKDRRYNNITRNFVFYNEKTIFNLLYKFKIIKTIISLDKEWIEVFAKKL
ncbi:class I SAM-dependent methyltransferase [Candidatus Woesearchaeota archaeon]|nr:class I SAM-dependent methyltransferase [Candidatus Woesearchaeota archaeon]